MTTPQELAQVIAGAESHLGIKPRHVRAAAAVLAYFGERREPGTCEHVKLLESLERKFQEQRALLRAFETEGFHAAVELCAAQYHDHACSYQRELAAQAAAHGESVRELQVRLLKLEAALVAASHALRSYQFSNSSPDLAQATADRLDALLAEVGK